MWFRSLVLLLSLLAITVAYAIGTVEFFLQRIGPIEWALAGIILLFSLRFFESAEGEKLIGYLRYPPIVAALALFVFGAYFDSPWVNAFSLGCMVLGLILIVRPGLLLNDLVRLSGIALCFYPLPSTRLRQMSADLQRYSADISSYMLDSLGIIHFKDGVQFHLQSGPVQDVQEACSGLMGISFLFALYAVYVAYKRKRLWVAIPVALALAPLAMAGNALRITTVCVAQVWYNTDLAHGAVHILLGIGTIGLSGLLLYSFQLWLEFLPHIEEDLGSPLWHALYVVENSQEESGIWPWLHTAAFCLLAAVCTCCGGVYAYYAPPSIPEMVATLEQMPPRQMLPSEYFGFQLQYIDTEPRSNKGQKIEWWYKHPLSNEELVIIIDYPFYDVHTVELCYQGSGFAIAGDIIDREGGYREVPLERLNQRYRLSYFQLRQDGELVAGSNTAWSRFASRSVTLRIPNYQVQARTSEVAPVEMHAQIMEDLRRRLTAFIQEQ